MATTSTSAEPAFEAPFKNYSLSTAYDEMFESAGAPRAHYSAFFDQLKSLPEALRHRTYMARPRPHEQPYPERPPHPGGHRPRLR